jgi:D-sedoheptulose 7-phosphate isomerase
MVKSIQVLALDIDGVLTDGTALLTECGGEEKRFSFRDLDAVTQAKNAGLKVVLVTGEDSPAVDLTSKRFGIQQVMRGAEDKLAALKRLAAEFGVSPGEVCYIGDSERDAPALAAAGLALAPANASPSARAAAHRVLSSAGGYGAVAEAVTLLLNLNGNGTQQQSYQTAIRDTLADSLNAHQRLLDRSLPVLAQVASEFIKAIRGGWKILLFGNGGSAAEAQHVAGELVGRFARESDPWPAVALTTDTSILTAVGNDWDFSEIFARQVRALAKPGDVVVGISTSGRSLNVLRGLEEGKRRGAITIGFTGAEGGPIGQYSDICFRAPADTTPRIQELSLLAWHSICELVEQVLVEDQATHS